jgi:hypothetical protein
MKILIDMNLTPEWTALVESDGGQAVHWSQSTNRAPESVSFLSPRKLGFTAWACPFRHCEGAAKTTG